MKPLRKEELISYQEYERQRDAFRRRIIDLKRRRRISLGEEVTLVFENRDTIQFQIQEMLRVEHIVAPEKVQDELDVYNALLPGDGELSATLFIEITDEHRLKELLDTFKGVDRGATLSIEVGRHRVYGEFEGGRSHEEKISAVHFVKFRPDAAFLEAFASGRQPVTISFHHEPYHREVPVPEAMRREWLADLGLDTLSPVRS